MSLIPAGARSQRADATETDVRAGLVLIFPRAPCRSDVRDGVFPRAASDALAFEDIGILNGCVVREFGVEIAHRRDAGLGVDRAGPLGDVAGHVEEAVRVGAVDARLRSDEVAILRIIAFIRLEVGKEASLLVFTSTELPQGKG